PSRCHGPTDRDDWLMQHTHIHTRALPIPPLPSRSGKLIPTHAQPSSTWACATLCLLCAVMGAINGPLQCQNARATQPERLHSTPTPLLILWLSSRPPRCSPPPRAEAALYAICAA
ncbi:unnamed protein product, partial [Lampetra planeri]